MDIKSKQENLQVALNGAFLYSIILDILEKLAKGEPWLEDILENLAGERLGAGRDGGDEKGNTLEPPQEREAQPKPDQVVRRDSETGNTPGGSSPKGPEDEQPSRRTGGRSPSPQPEPADRGGNPEDRTVSDPGTETSRIITSDEYKSDLEKVET